MIDIRKICLMLLALVMTSVAGAQTEFVSDNITYGIKDDGTAEAKSITVAEGTTDVVIPAVVSSEGSDYKVTSIASYFLMSTKGVTNLTLGDNIETVGEYAFYDLADLKSVKMGNNVKTISSSAFDTCVALESINLSTSLTTLGSYAFSSCYALKEIVIPDGVENLMSKTFADCTSLVKVTLGKNTRTVGTDDYYSAQADIFKDCTALKEVVFNDNLEIIGSGAFQGCSALESIVLPAGLKLISNYSFSGCESVKTIDFSKCTQLESIGNSAFAKSWSGGATQIENLVLPESLKTLGDKVFRGSNSLLTVVLPDNLESIGESTFEDCEKLEEVTIPGKVTKLPAYLFSGCSGLKKLIFKAGDTLYGDDSALSGCMPQHIYVNRNVEAFASCDMSNLKVLEIGEDITVWNADCVGPGIEKVVLYLDDPRQLVPEFDEETYANATLSVYKGMQYIFQDFTAPGWNKFANVTEFGEVYKDGGISYLVNDIEGKARVTFGETMDDARKNYMGSVEIPATVTLNGKVYDVTSVAGYAFNGCEGLNSVKMPSSIKRIGYKAFSECKNMKEAALPANLEWLGESAFEWCESIKSVTIPAAIKKLHYGVFMSCSAMENVTFPAGFEYVGSNAFNGCSSIVSITLPETVSHIGNFAFNNCSALESFDIPVLVDSIGECAFAKCSSLKSIELKNNVTKVMAGAFDQSGLEKVIIGSNVQTICEGAFSNCQQLTDLIFEDAAEPLTIDAGLAENKWGSHSFKSCPIERLTIGRELIGFDGWVNYFLEELTLGAELNAWHDNYCETTCNKVIAKMSDAAQLVPNFKNEIYQNAVLVVPAGLKADYQAAEGWKNFNTVVEEGETIDPELSFSEQSVEYDLSSTEAFAEPVLNNAKNVAVTYSSSNENIATVNASTGKVTFTKHAVGEVIITAVSEATDIFMEGSASYTINVTDVNDMVSVESVMNGDVEVVAIYSANGVKRNELAKGLNIVKLADGRIVKVIAE